MGKMENSEMLPETMVDLSDKLGAYESSRQLDEIKMTKSLLSDQLINAKKDVADNSKTYRAMSFFAGVVIAILLV